jgi:hypothetical protein
MSEKPTSKQQYVEGPWQTVSGNTPMNTTILEGWKSNLDNTYGSHNWRATPVEGKPDKFTVETSPDVDNPNTELYSEMARWADQEGNTEHPVMQQKLGELALHNYEPSASVSTKEAEK